MGLFPKQNTLLVTRCTLIYIEKSRIRKFGNYIVREFPFLVIFYIYKCQRVHRRASEWQIIGLIFAVFYVGYLMQGSMEYLVLLVLVAVLLRIFGYHAGISSMTKVLFNVLI